MAEEGEKQPAQQRAYAKSLPGVDRSKAARIYIDGYYKNLLEQTEQRQKRYISHYLLFDSVRAQRRREFRLCWDSLSSFPICPLFYLSGLRIPSAEI